MNKHYTFQEYLEKFTSEQDSYDYYFELQKEIDRLNNIINELEEYICAIEYDERHSDSWQIPVRIHNKLKELKDSDKD